MALLQQMPARIARQEAGVQRIRTANQRQRAEPANLIPFDAHGDDNAWLASDVVPSLIGRLQSETGDCFCSVSGGEGRTGTEPCGCFGGASVAGK